MKRVEHRRPLAFEAKEAERGEHQARSMTLSTHGGRSLTDLLTRDQTVTRWAEESAEANPAWPRARSWPFRAVLLQTLSSFVE